MPELPDATIVHIYALEFDHPDPVYDGLVYVGITWGEKNAQSRVLRHLRRTSKESRRYLPATNNGLRFAGVIQTHQFGAWHNAEADILCSYEAAGWYAPQVNKDCRWPMEHTPEALEKIGAAHRGRPLTAEHRAHISAGEKGMTLTPEHRAAIAASMTGRRFTPEHRAHLSISSARKGKAGTFLGHRHTDQSRAKISASKRATSAARRAADAHIGD